MSSVSLIDYLGAFENEKLKLTFDSVYKCYSLVWSSIITMLVFCVCVCVCVFVCLSVCLSLCLFVPSEILWMGRRSTALLTPTWRASPGKLHKPLLELIRCTIREKKVLEVFPRLRVDSRIPRKDFRWWSCLQNSSSFGVEGHAPHVSEPTHSWTSFTCQNLPVHERVSSSLL